MAQTLYDSSPTWPLHQYNYHEGNPELSSHIPDAMKSVSANREQVDYTMSHKKGSPKKRLSRLELLRSDYSKKLQIEREEKIRRLQIIQQENGHNQGSSNGGMVRGFFAERRALEATRKGQKNPELLPSIESHFRMVRDKKQEPFPEHTVRSRQNSKTNLTHGKPFSVKQEPFPSQKPLPTKYSSRTQTKTVGVTVRKRTKGVDKQDPLPPVNKGQSEVTRRKPPTPNKRYETHSVLKQDDVEAFEYSGPSNLPIPPIERRPKRSKVPLPPPSAEDLVSDFDDAQSTLTDYSNIAPNLSKLKAKALKQRQLSKQQLIDTNKTQENAKLTDFQKWQMEQDQERIERLEKHKQKSELSLSQRENELLKQIQEEQLRLEKLKLQREELVEQEIRQKEEDEKWLAEKQSLEEQAIIPQQTLAKDSNQTKKVALKKASTLPKVPRKVKTPPQQLQGEELDTTEKIHDNAYRDFYEHQTQDVGEVSVDVSPCSICGRKFAVDRLAKHVKICAKSSKSKRKVFDTRKHRSEGTEHEKYVQSGKYLEEPKAKVGVCLLILPTYSFGMSGNFPSRESIRGVKHEIHRDFKRSLHRNPGSPCLEKVSECAC